MTGFALGTTGSRTNVFITRGTKFTRRRSSIVLILKFSIDTLIACLAFTSKRSSDRARGT